MTPTASRGSRVTPTRTVAAAADAVAGPPARAAPAPATNWRRLGDIPQFPDRRRAGQLRGLRRLAPAGRRRRRPLPGADERADREVGVGGGDPGRRVAS